MMTTEPITESEMTFGPFTEGHCFYIEKSVTYKKIENGVKIAEFLVLKQKKGKGLAVWIIEAKKSAPASKGIDPFEEQLKEICSKLTSEESNEYLKELQEKITGDKLRNYIKELREQAAISPFDKYIKEICEKFINSLALIISILLKQDDESDELSNLFKELDLASIQFILVLVIKEAKLLWLPDLQNALSKALRPTVKIWAVSEPSVLVLNEQGARDRGLIV